MSNQKKQMQKENAPDYVSPNYSFTGGCRCPACGKEMDAAVYYVAELAGQSTWRDNSWQMGGKKEIITKYRNVRSNVGGVCVDCFKKSRRIEIILEAVLTSVLLALAILSAAHISYNGFNALICAVVGFYCLKWVFVLSANLLRIHYLNGHTDNSKRGDTLSFVYVNAYEDCKNRPCESNEVMIDCMDYRRLKEQSEMSPVPNENAPLATPAQITIVRENSVAGGAVPTIVFLNGEQVCALKNGCSDTITLTRKPNVLMTNAVGSSKVRYAFKTADGARGVIHVKRQLSFGEETCIRRY